MIETRDDVILMSQLDIERLEAKMQILIAELLPTLTLQGAGGFRSR